MPGVPLQASMAIYFRVYVPTLSWIKTNSKLLIYLSDRVYQYLHRKMSDWENSRSWYHHSYHLSDQKKTSFSSTFGFCILYESGTQFCPTLCNPMDCSLPGFTVHRILQARILEWVAMPFSRGSSQPRDRTQVTFIEGRFFTI